MLASVQNIRKSRATEREKLRSRHPPTDILAVPGVQSPRRGRGSQEGGPTRREALHALRHPKRRTPPGATIAHVWTAKLDSAWPAIGYRCIFAGTEDLSSVLFGEGKWYL